jgi:hypothetical protein
MMVALAKRIQSGNHEQQNLFDSVVGQLQTNKKRWVVDIDGEPFASPLMMAYIDHECKPMLLPIEFSKIEAIIIKKIIPAHT